MKEDIDMAKDTTAADAKKVEADKKAAEATKKAAEAKASAEKIAAKAKQEAEKAKAKADADAVKAKEKAAADAVKLKEKAAADALKASEKAAKEAEKVAKKAAKDAEREARKNAPKVPKVKPWEDLQAGAEQQAPREGSALHTALELIRTHKGATLPEIQAAIGEKHIAHRLLAWANRERGYGFVMAKTTQKIQALAPNLRVPKVAAQPAAN